MNDFPMTLLRDLLDEDEAKLVRGNPSVLPVFGRNLRMLTSLRGTQTRISKELDIGRVQFRRYLFSESFPKPNILKKICDYFNVDARILTEPLTERLMQDMRACRKPHDQFSQRRSWISGLDFAAPDHDYFQDFRWLQNGLYVAWHRSLMQHDVVARVLIRVFEQDGTKVFRGYMPKFSCPKDTPAKEREFRGTCLSLKTGYAFLTFYAKPSEMFATSFVAPVHLPGRHGEVLGGFWAAHRPEVSEIPRLTRLIVEPLRQEPGVMVEQAHCPSYLEPADVPEPIRNFILQPVG